MLYIHSVGLDKCKLTYGHHHIIIQGIFTAWKITKICARTNDTEQVFLFCQLPSMTKLHQRLFALSWSHFLPVTSYSCLPEILPPLPSALSIFSRATGYLQEAFLPYTPKTRGPSFQSISLNSSPWASHWAQLWLNLFRHIAEFCNYSVWPQFVFHSCLANPLTNFQSAYYTFPSLHMPQALMPLLSPSFNHLWVNNLASYSTEKTRHQSHTEARKLGIVFDLFPFLNVISNQLPFQIILKSLGKRGTKNTW